MTGLLKDMRFVGIACAVAAVGSGIIYMMAAGAPGRYPFVNGAALLIGLLLFAAVDQLPARLRNAPVALAIGLALMATALFGVSGEGATRWAKLGPILIQPSLILLPMLVVLLARTREPLAMAGALLAAVALAIQPDRAMAGALAASLAALALWKRDLWSAAGLLGAIACFAVTLLRPDALPAMPYVDGILYSAFGVHPLAGIAVVGGAALLLVPAISGWGQGHRHASVLFGTIWFAIIAAAALGNYPTPLVGYGGSAVIGYLLSLSVFPKASRSEKAPVASTRGQVIGENDGSSLAASLN